MLFNVFWKKNENSNIIENPIKEMNNNNILIEVNNPIIVTVVMMSMKTMKNENILIKCQKEIKMIF